MAQAISELAIERILLGQTSATERHVETLVTGHDLGDVDWSANGGSLVFGGNDASQGIRVLDLGTHQNSNPSDSAADRTYQSRHRFDTMHNPTSPVCVSWRFGGNFAMLRVRRVIASMLVLAAVAMVSGAQTKPVYSRLPLTEEQLSVYRGFLEKFETLHIKNLSKITVPLDFKDFPEGRPCLSGMEIEGSEALKSSHAFGPEITKGRELNLVDPLEQIRLLEKRAKQSGQREDDLNFLIFSEIAFDRTHRYAVVKYLLVCGKHCDSGQTLVMEKIGGHWTTSSRRACALFVI
jgi:hypothetical protein